MKCGSVSYRRVDDALTYKEQKFMRTMKDMKKVLAAVMVLAVALAGVFVAFDATEDSDAAISTSEELKDLPTDGAITAAGSYYVKETSTVQVNSSAAIIVKLFVADGAKLTLSTTHGVSVEVYLAESAIDADKKVDYDAGICYKDNGEGTSAEMKNENGALVGSSDLEDKLTYGLIVPGEGTDKVYYKQGYDYLFEKNAAPESDVVFVLKDGSLKINTIYTSSPTNKNAVVSLLKIKTENEFTVTVKEDACPELKGGAAGATGSILILNDKLEMTEGYTHSDGLKFKGVTDQKISTLTSGSTIGIDSEVPTTCTEDLFIYGETGSNKTVTMNEDVAITFVGANVTALQVKVDESVVGSVSISGSAKITAKADHVEITEFNGVDSGSLTLVSGNFKTSSTGSNVEIQEGMVLTIAGSAIFELKADVDVSGGKVILNGTIDGDSKTVIVSATGFGPTDVKGEFRAFSGSKIMKGVTIELGEDPGVIDISAAMSTAEISGRNTTDIEYPQSQKIVVGINGLDVVENSEIIINGGFEIPFGVTVTVQEGSEILVKGSTSEVKIDGTLIVENGARFEVQGAKSVAIAGVVESETAETGTTTKAELSFSAVSVEIKDKGVVNSNGMIAGSAMTVGMGGILNISGVSEIKSISNNGMVSIENVILSENLAVSFKSTGAVLNVVSYVVEDSQTLKVNDSGLKYNNKELSGENSVVFTALSGSSGSENVKTGYGGITLKSQVVQEKDGSEKKDVKKLDIGGTIAVYNPNEATSIIPSDGGIVVSGNGIIVSGDLSLGEEVRIKVGSGVLTVDGSISAMGDDSKISAVGKIVVNGLISIKGADMISSENMVTGAFYKIKDPKGVTTSYYSTLQAAIDSGVKSIELYGEFTVEESVEVPAGVTINNKATLQVGTTDSRDTVLTFLNGSALKGNTLSVKGTLIFESKVNNKVSSINSDVSVVGNVSSKYTNIYTAMNGAVEGDVVTVTSESIVELDADLTVKGGVALAVPAGKEIKVMDDVAVVIDGTLMSYSGLKAETAFAEKESENSSMLVVNGTFMTGQAGSIENIADEYKTSGAYYVITGTAGTYTYISPLSIAADRAVDAVDIKVIGKNTVSDVTIKGSSTVFVTVSVVGAKSELAGNLVLDNAAFVVGNTAKYTGAVSSAVGTVEASNIKNVKVGTGFDSDDNALLVISGTPAKADSTIDDDASFAVTSGIVSVYGTDAADKLTVNAPKTKLKISADATLAVYGEFKVKTLTISGTLSVKNGGSFVAEEYVEVPGVLDVVEASSNTSSAGTVKVPILYVGITKSKATTGVAAAVNATEVQGLNTIYLAAGATVSEDILDDFTKNTKLSVDGADYMTVYTNADVKISSIKKPTLEGAKVLGWLYKNTSGKMVDAAELSVGDVDTVVADVKTDVYNLVLTADYGITDVYVDGILVGSMGLSFDGAMEAFVAYGTHQVTYKLASGYGGSVKVTFDGNQATDGKFTITKDMDFNKIYEVIISGVEVVDTPTPAPTPVSPAQDDDSMGITEYLLIVLVILAAILVVVVAIRMMRS